MPKAHTGNEDLKPVVNSVSYTDSDLTIASVSKNGCKVMKVTVWWERVKILVVSYHIKYRATVCYLAISGLWMCGVLALCRRICIVWPKFYHRWVPIGSLSLASYNYLTCGTQICSVASNAWNLCKIINGQSGKLGNVLEAHAFENVC